MMYSSRRDWFFQLFTTAAAIFTLLFLGAHVFPGTAHAADDNWLELTDGWHIQAASEISDSGAILSTDGNFAGWHAATVPTTVLHALVQDGTFTNIYMGTNLASIPTAPFTNAWWFGTEFNASPAQAAGNADLVFEGINYRANVWLNGRSVGTTNDAAGAFRIFKFNVGGVVRAGRNVLAVEIFPPRPGDFSMGFVDWNPRPPDRNMGLFRPVKLHFFPEVALENVFVESKIDHATWRQAELTVSAELVNRATNVVDAVVEGAIGEIRFAQKFTLQPGESRSIQITPAECPDLRLEKAKLWWPWELGEPYLYNLKLAVQVNGRSDDQTALRFGIREVKDYITADGYRGYSVNGHQILIRGGGWADDLLLHEDTDNLRAQVQYTRAMNLNTIRLEGIWGCSQRLYDLADENGLLIMVGWSCQWEWAEYLGGKTDPKYGGFRTEAQMDLATNYLHDQVCWLRNHPSIFLWVLGSDMLPQPVLEKRYDALLAIIDPTRPRLISCSTVASKVSGPSAVKMNGPYDYVTPNYWYEDTQNGGAFGFNTETGPGPQPPPIETLQRMIPADQLWPMGDAWEFHCGRGKFHNLNRYLRAFDARYGPAQGVEEFAFKSQAANYEAIRAMYEAFAVNRPHTTGIIQWMLNASWPKLYWQLYDYYLVPGGAFFGAKKGAAPVAVIYDTADQGVYLVNQGKDALAQYQTKVTVYNLASQKILEQTVTNDSPAGSSQKVMDLSALKPGSVVYFVDLAGQDPAVPAAAADNFYWLSTKPDVLDEANSVWYVTPNKSFADFRPLSTLPTATVKVSGKFRQRKGGGEATITLSNDGDTLAFFIEMKIIGAQSQQILTPVFWSDNYVSLPPHTRRTYSARFPAGEVPQLKLAGWNVKFDRSAFP